MPGPKMTELKSKWRDWINELLKRSGLNASELAERIGVSRMAVSKWRSERYPNIPSDDHKEKLVSLAKSMDLL